MTDLCAALPMQALRRRRALAARLLAQADGQAGLCWDDLAQWPGWALLPRDRIDALAWAVGAWWHADALRRCIDGRVLGLLRDRLGVEACKRLMALQAAPAASTVSGPLAADDALIEHGHVDALFAASGIGVLLAGVESPALRRCLRELWWPGLPYTDAPMLEPAYARALSDCALAQLPWAEAATP